MSGAGLAAADMDQRAKILNKERENIISRLQEGGGREILRQRQSDHRNALHAISTHLSSIGATPNCPSEVISSLQDDQKRITDALNKIDCGEHI